MIFEELPITLYAKEYEVGKIYHGTLYTFDLIKKTEYKALFLVQELFRVTMDKDVRNEKPVTKCPTGYGAMVKWRLLAVDGTRRLTTEITESVLINEPFQVNPKDLPLYVGYQHIYPGFKEALCDL